MNTAGCLQEGKAPPRGEMQDLPEPVDMEVDVDMCAQCGMKIVDQRFAGEKER